jgi:hypothetical protein
MISIQRSIEVQRQKKEHTLEEQAARLLQGESKQQFSKISSLNLETEDATQNHVPKAGCS